MNKELMYNFINKWYGQVLLTLISALLLILSTAGFGLSFTVFFAFIPLLFALNAEKSRPVITGWLLGFLYWAVCLSWMMITFGYFGGAPLPAAFGLLMFIALSGGFFFFVPFTYAAAKISKNPIILSLIFVMLEAIKGKVFFGGVPWLNLAQSQYQNTLIVQNVSVFGEYGLSFIIMLINFFLYYIIKDYKNKKIYYMLASAVIIMILPGIYRMINPVPYTDTKKIAVVQPAYKQEIKWDNNYRIQIINEVNSLVLKAYNADVDMIVLPESSYPAKVLATDMIMSVLNKVSEKTPVIFGADRRMNIDNKSRLFNTMVLLDNKSLSFYDKRHLTPFGEYFPFEKLLAPVKEFFFGPGDMFTPGEKATVLASSKTGIYAGPVICFESAFSSLAGEPVRMGANMLVIISNDTWFGKNQGRIQHLAVDTIRSVEYGRSAVRATQDGISAFIMPDGKIPLKEDKQIPAILIYDVPVTNFMTFYSLAGNIWIAILIPLLYYQMKRKKKKDNLNG